VLSSCRTWALTLPDSYAGIVGGLTRRDRKQAREARTARDEAVARIGRTPQRSRVVRALLADPRRSNRVIAASTTVQADHSTVRAVRHEMEAAGLIQPYRAPYGPGPRRRRTPLQERARAALLADAARSNRVVAEQLGMTSHARVQAMRHQLERDDLIPVYRAPYGPYGTMGACR
jgi:DNA-binding MarR family transcriptional regulator